MKKTRYIPYGYTIRNGRVGVEDAEALATHARREVPRDEGDGVRVGGEPGEERAVAQPREADELTGVLALVDDVTGD